MHGACTRDTSTEFRAATGKIVLLSQYTAISILVLASLPHRPFQPQRINNSFKFTIWRKLRTLWICAQKLWVRHSTIYVHWLLIKSQCTWNQTTDRPFECIRWMSDRSLVRNWPVRVRMRVKWSKFSICSKSIDAIYVVIVFANGARRMELHQWNWSYERMDEKSKEKRMIERKKVSGGRRQKEIEVERIDNKWISCVVAIGH